MLSVLSKDGKERWEGTEAETTTFFSDRNAAHCTMLGGAKAMSFAGFSLLVVRVPDLLSLCLSVAEDAGAWTGIPL